MSVKGEFVRLVGDAAASLRSGSEDAQALADGLEELRGTARTDLASAADALLTLWDAEPAGRLDLPPAARERLDDASERMLAVARIILGR